MKIAVIAINDENEVYSTTVLIMDYVDLEDAGVIKDIKKGCAEKILEADEDNLEVLNETKCEELLKLLKDIGDNNTEKVIYNKDKDSLTKIDLTDFSTFENIDFEE